MSFWNPFRIKQNSVVAIIDIGSAEVSGALVSVSVDQYGQKQNQIIFNTKVETGIEGDLNFERFDFEITKAIKIVTHNLVKSGFNQPEKFVCFLASPFLISQTKIVSYSQNDGFGFVFTPKILDSIIRREAENFCFDNETGGLFNIIENKVMQIKLDGYEIEQPFGHKVNQITISQFMSGSPVSQLEKIWQAVSSQSHNDNIEFHSYAFAAFSTLRDNLGDKKNFIAVDISGELTDVFVCMNGILLENISFPCGLNSILRGIALSQRTPLAEAKTQLSLYTEGRLHSRAKEVLEQSLDLARQKWISGMVEVLSLVLETTVIPEQIILTGDTKVNKFFIDWLEEGDFKKYMLSNNPFKVSYIYYSKLAEMIGGVKTVRNTYLIFESMFLEKINK